jgi:hypothetical protein
MNHWSDRYRRLILNPVEFLSHPLRPTLVTLNLGDLQKQNRLDPVEFPQLVHGRETLTERCISSGTNGLIFTGKHYSM